MTITEALAEIKTISKRISAKREFINTYLIRLENVKDPLEKEGGSVQAIASALQAVKDLEERLVLLRQNIQTANEITNVTIEGKELSIANWLIWRREVAPLRVNFLKQISSNLRSIRESARRNGQTLLPPNQADAKANDIIVHINEHELSKEIEKLENILGQLDGQLSLKNATVMI